jgi:triosephosphate isomerase
MNWPTLVVNLKNYFVGQAAKDYAVKAADVALKVKKPFAVCPSVADMDKFYCAVNKHNPEAFNYLSVYAQKVDDVEAGEKKTGHVCIDSLVNATGTLLNHAETRVYGSAANYTEQDYNTLMSTIEKVRKRSDFALIVCADNYKTAGKIAQGLKDKGLTENTALAIEWDEFIGKVSIVNEKPEEITKAVEAVKAIDQSLPVYCGACVETAEEINKARKDLGAQGALAATGFTKAPKFNGDFSLALESVLSAVD